MASMNDFLRQWHSDNPTVKAFTSGSTGLPKEIELLKSDMRLSAENTIRFFGLNEGSVLGVPLSADYIAGKMMAVRADVCGATLMELPVSNKIRLERPVDLLAVVPSQLSSVLKLDKGLIGNLLIGGAPMSSEQEDAVAESRINAWIGFGMTETCSHIALRRVGYEEYKAVGDISFSQNADGCLVIHSDSFSWRTLETRDIVDLTGPTTFRWIGRLDNVINSGGIKIHPELLESEIRRIFPDLPEFFITAIPNLKWGQSPAMVIESQLDKTHFISVLREKLKDVRHIPTAIFITNKLIRSSNNKLKRIIPSDSHEI